MWKYFTIFQIHYCHRFSFTPYLCKLVLVQYPCLCPHHSTTLPKWRAPYTTGCKYVSWIRYSFGGGFAVCRANGGNHAQYRRWCVHFYAIFSQKYISISLFLLCSVSWKWRKFCLLLHSIESKRCIKFTRPLQVWLCYFRCIAGKNTRCIMTWQIN